MQHNSYIKLPVGKARTMCLAYFTHRYSFSRNKIQEKAQSILSENKSYNSKWWHFFKKTEDLFEIEDALMSGNLSKTFSSEYFPYSSYYRFIMDKYFPYDREVAQFYKAILSLDDAEICYMPQSVISQITDRHGV